MLYNFVLWNGDFAYDPYLLTMLSKMICFLIPAPDIAKISALSNALIWLWDRRKGTSSGRARVWLWSSEKLLTYQRLSFLSSLTVKWASHKNRLSGLSLRVRPSMVQNLACRFPAAEQRYLLKRGVLARSFENFSESFLMLNPRSLACLL